MSISIKALSIPNPKRAPKDNIGKKIDVRARKFLKKSKLDYAQNSPEISDAKYDKLKKEILDLIIGAKKLGAIELKPKRQFYDYIKRHFY